MKILEVKKGDFASEGRWDLDYHLPPTEILKFPDSSLKRVDQVAEVSKLKWNPESSPEETFKYIDISCIDTVSGIVTNYQELLGSEAPSRARKLVCQYDVIVSTVRPTRRAVAVIGPSLHNEVCSTGFVVLSPQDINPFYLKFALRLPSTSEQLRKFATGSSYPAILDSDIQKTLIPVPSIDDQDRIVAEMLKFEFERLQAIAKANQQYNTWEDSILSGLQSTSAATVNHSPVDDSDFSYQKIMEAISNIDKTKLRGSGPNQATTPTMEGLF